MPTQASLNHHHPDGLGTAPRRRAGRWIGLVLLVVLTIKLSTWGLFWGMPAVSSWSPDTIAGSRTLFSLGNWPANWQGHYPPLHFLINQTAYRPVLAHWQDAGVMVTDPDTGQMGLAPPLAPKFGLLILVSRAITVAMSLLTVLALVATANALSSDRTAALLAGLTMATCAEWVFFSHLGNLDIPHVFWFTLGLYAYVRAWQTDATRYFVSLGLLTACAVSTKDAVAGAFAGVALVLCARRILNRRARGASAFGALSAVIHRKMLIGLAAFVIPYVLIQGILVNPQGYVSRMEYWLRGPGVSGFNTAYQGPVWLLGEAATVWAKAFGWPMFVVMILAAIYGLRHRPGQSLLMIVPSVTYYLIVCSSIHMVYARMLFPVYICLSVLVGRFLADFLRQRFVPRAMRIGAVILLFAGSIGYCVAVDLEMLADTRYQAEAWLTDRADPAEAIGVFSDPQYLPRFSPGGHRAIRLDMSPGAIADERPTHLIVTSFNYDEFDDARRRCMADLLAGGLGYRVVASFDKRYLPPKRHWLSLAAWGTRGAGKMSPDITILRRADH